MDLKGIMAISGYPGLYKMVSQAKNSIIVESLNDGKRMPAFNSYKISSLEDIAIFTDTKEVPLKEVFQKMLDKFENKPTIDPKSSNNELVKVFSEVLPEYDKEKVYVSDIKKVISWYNTLVEKDLLKTEPEKKETEEVPKEEVVEEDKPKKATKKVAAKDKTTTVAKPKSKPKAQTKPAGVKKTTAKRKVGE